jgi:hypothetical protein
MLVVFCPLILLLAIGANGASDKVDARSVWRPSQEALRLLRENADRGEGTPASLLEIMRDAGASPESISFSASFSREAAYLASLEPPQGFDGFTVGRIVYAFRREGASGVVILNAKPRVIEVSDPQYHNRIDITSSRDFGELGIPPSRAQCAWNEPGQYFVQPGVHDRTEVEVKFPVKELPGGSVIAEAYVIFEFSPRDRRLLRTYLDFIRKTGGQGTHS